MFGQESWVSGSKWTGLQPILLLRIEMYIEDKISHRGPFSLTVIPSQTVAALKQQVFKKFQIPVEVQRWILGNVLVLDDDCTLEEFRIAAGSSVFLYLVSPAF
ncbi:hypothetical protein HUJ05_009717 [Dendroctonus ponderosae]|nr:hypothetical protein HUJ05_009717 [Dendroctonus ponderosae]